MAIVSVFGLGYVGSVLAACLADNGHRVVGVDSNPVKTSSLAEGRSPVVEPGLDDLIKRAAAKGSIQTTTDASQAVRASDISMICVGTPTNYEGSVDLGFVTKVSEEIGTALREKPGRHVVVVRSTVLPGTTEAVVVPALERTSGKQAGKDFGICFNPEFLREGTSIQDFLDPPFTVIGTNDDRAAKTVTNLYST